MFILTTKGRCVCLIEFLKGIKEKFEGIVEDLEFGLFDGFSALDVRKFVKAIKVNKRWYNEVIYSLVLYYAKYLK